ncbi:MAG: hypothetical protein IJ624_07015 [Prevotella sp.]|nr:hypothetical protein [Prevotella sp.]
MAKKIKKINVASDKKGTVKNPYTVEEHEQMLAAGQWTENGFVEELGLVEGEPNDDYDYAWEYGLYGYDEEEREKKKWEIDCVACVIADILGKSRRKVRNWIIGQYGAPDVEEPEVNDVLDHYFDNVEPVNKDNINSQADLDPNYEYIGIRLEDNENLHAIRITDYGQETGKLIYRDSQAAFNNESYGTSNVVVGLVDKADISSIYRVRK